MNQEIQSFELTELFSSLPKSVRSPCKNEYIVSADDELQILNTDELKTTEAEKGLIKSIWCDDKVRLLTQSKELFQGFLNRVISVENQNKETELLDRSIVSKLLHLCCMFDAVDCSSALINGEFGTVPLVNEMDDTGRSALHKAAEVHASRCIELLLRKRARTDVKTKNGGSQLALELSLSSRRMDVVWNVDDPIEDLLVCLNQKDLTAVRLLAETTKDVAQVAFTIAMEGQVVSLAALLMVCAERVISSMVVVRKDANRVYKEKTVYDCVIREALSLGQIITPSTVGDGTCAETDTGEIVEKRKLLLCEMELLQLYGAIAQSVSIDKKVTSQLIRASQAGDEAVVKLLLTAKMDVNDTDVEGNSALHWCVKTPTGLASKQIGVICLLIKHGARVNQRNKLGYTALHFAAASGNMQAIQILLSQDPDGINAYNEMKETPLFVAVKNDYIDCVELLLCCGANSEVLNIRKQRPIDFAKSQDMRFMLSSANIDFLNRAISNQQKQKDGVVSETRMDEDTIVEKKWPKTKTEVCKYFESSTGCVRGAKCFYAHGQEELRPKQGMQPTEDRIVEEYKRKIFVGGLPPTVYSDTLGKYFEHFGSIEEAKVIGVKTENNQVQSRGFGFVTFKNEKSVLAAVQAHYMTIMGKPVEIKTAFSRSQLLKEYMQNLLPPEEQEEEYYNPVVVECETPNSSEKRSLKLQEVQEEEMCTTEQMSWADKLLLTQPKTSSIESSSQTHLTPTSDDKSQPAWLCTFKKWFPKFLKEVYKRYGKGEWYPLSSVKADFRITCGQELDHVSLGYPKLSEFMKSLPGICRMQTVPVNGREPASHMVLLPNLTKRKLITPMKILENPSKAKSVDEKGDGSSDDSKVPSKVNTDSDGSKVPSKVDTDSDGSKFLQDVLSVSYENIEEKKNVPLEIPKVILDEKDDFPYCVPTRFLQFLEPDPLFHGRLWLRNQRGTEDIFGGRGMGRHLVLEALAKRRKNTSVFFLREYDFYQDYKASLVRRKCFGCGKGKMAWACFPCEHLLWCSDCKLHAIKAAGIYVHKCVICDAKVERYCAIPPWNEKYSQMYDEYYEVPHEKELPPIDSFYMQVKKKSPFLGY